MNTPTAVRRALLAIYALVMLALPGVSFAIPPPPPLQGSIFTTDSTCGGVNLNLYNSKLDVYLNGGPEGHGPGLPDGYYYVKVTDPSGTVLGTSVGTATPTPVHVTGGVFDQCYQLWSLVKNGVNQGYLDTPNPGGEYKVWVSPDSGFVQQKTDNFKVKKPGVAYVSVCKFNDFNSNHVQDSGEPLIAHWPITATGVDVGSGTGTLPAQTNDGGCFTFAYSGGLSNHVITLTEDTFGSDWTRTAPVDGSSGAWSVTAGVITVTVNPGDVVVVPDFGNHNDACVDADECNLPLDHLVVTKDATPAFSRTFTWGIEKSVDKSRINTTAGADATFNYTVSVTHDTGNDSAWTVKGTIKVSNPGGTNATGVDVTDSVGNGGTCVVTDGTGLTILAGTHQNLSYTCTYVSEPSPKAGTNTATATAGNVTGDSGTADFDFATTTPALIDDSVTISDTIGGSLGSVSSTDASPTLLYYTKKFTAPSGTCEDHPNTASFTTNTSGATGDSSKSVKVCGGVDLTVSKSADATFTRTYTWSIEKLVDKTVVNQVGGSATFNYTVNVKETGFTDSAWKVTGTITVTNPNDWEAITATVTDSIDNGGTCTVTGGVGVSVPAGGNVPLAYSCTYVGFVSTPASGTNKATATWVAATFFTPHGSAEGTAGVAFGAPTTTVNKTVTINDTFNAVTVPLAGLTATDAPAFTSIGYQYSHTILNTAAGAPCASYLNTARIVETGQTATQTVKICNTACTDTTGPSVTVTGTASNPSRVYITVKDNTGGSGLQSIGVTVHTNANVTWPAFVAPYTGSVVVTATKINASQTSVVGLLATDKCGNSTLFDPADVTVDSGRRQAVTISGVAGDENLVKIVNDGLAQMRMTVNNQVFEVNLQPGETRILDVVRALIPGTENTFTLEGRGKPGAHAAVFVYPGDPTNATSGRGHRYAVHEIKE